MRIKEEVINVVLAQVLFKKGLPISIPEVVERKKVPDVIVELYGLRILIEGRRESLSVSLFKDTHEKMKGGYGDIGIALLYPEKLYEVSTIDNLPVKIEDSKFSGALYYWSSKGIKRIKFSEKSIDNVIELFREILGIYVKNDILKNQVEEINNAIEKIVEKVQISDLWFSDKELIEKLMNVLGTPDEEIEKLKLDIIRITAFIIFNALLFHEILAGVRADVEQINTSKFPIRLDLIEKWEDILRIDYKPIFRLGLKIIKNLPSGPKIEQMLKDTARLAINIASSGTYLRHDLMGRIYHKLLLRSAGKYYSTYYTSIPAAGILANLIIKSPNKDTHWNLSEEIFLKDFKVIDPACGSGTLLSSIYTAIRNEYILYSEKRDIDYLHKISMEKILYGFDILDYASHLTLTTLSLHNPKASFEDSNIYTLPQGLVGKNVYLGSLDYLQSKQLSFELPVKRYELNGTEEVFDPVKVTPGSFDIVIMNPPYLRSAKPNVKFGHTEKEVKKKMIDALRKISRDFIIKLSNGKKMDLIGIGQAGLGAFFVFVGDKLLKVGGRLGLVLPRTVLSGVSWRKVRELLYTDYEIEFVISNFDPGNKKLGVDPWSWSENTNLGEVLIIARKTRKRRNLRKTKFINLWNKPTNAIESTLVSQQMCTFKNKSSLEEGYYEYITQNKKEVGAIYNIKQKEIKDSWLYPCVFSNPEINALLISLKKKIRKKNFKKFEAIPEVEHFGIDCGSISSNYQVSKTSTKENLVWGYKIDMNNIEIEKKNIKYGKKKSTKSYFEKSGNLLIPYTMYLQNHKLCSIYSNEKVLSNAFWTISILDEEYAKYLVLWLNSTFGLFELLSNGNSSKGFHFEFKQGNIFNILVPKKEGCSFSKSSILFKKISQNKFKTLAEEFGLAYKGNGLRRKIDEFFIEESDLKVNLRQYYKLLSKESILTLKRL